MRILVVEDDVFFQKFYSSKLMEAGHTVEIAVNGEDGLSKMRSFKPQLVLLDLIMPVKDGFEVLKEWKADPVLHTIPVFVFSTLSQKEEVIEAQKMGVRGYINKGMVDFDKTLAKITAFAAQ